MTYYRALHADDEHSAREHLVALLEPHTDVLLEAQCRSGKELIEAIPDIAPDVLFLDINLGDMTGFDVLHALPAIDFEIVFTTAYDQYAVQAFEIAAVDYLLKPFGQEQLTIAMERFRQRMLNKSYPNTIERLMRNMTEHIPQQEQIALATPTGRLFVTIADIQLCHSEGAFTTFFMDGGEQHIVTRSMKESDRLLSNYDFIRVNQTHLVNKQHVKRFDKRHKTVELKNGQSIEVSRHFEKDLLGRWKLL